MTNRLFYTVKVSSSLLKEFNYDLSLSFEDCAKAGFIISLADSQILKSIRRLTQHTVDGELLEDWYHERDTLKKSKRNTRDRRKRILELQNNIYKMMYIPEYITVVMESEKDYSWMFIHGFKFNGVTYKRLSCSASQARVSTIVFVDEKIKDTLITQLNNGRKMDKPLAPSKYNAYFGLYSSSIKEVTKPRFCVVPDYCETCSVDVDYVIETDANSDDIIEPRTMDIEFNRFDGSGMISPQFSEVWGRDLGEDYTPCQFCIRTSFTKGMVNEFDFVEWCKKKNNGNYLIKDIYGNMRDLREIDIILSEGQVKLWDFWDSQEDFERNCDENHIVWGVTKYAPKQDKDVLVTNYQFLQTLNLSDSDIEALCEDTINYLQGVSYQNRNYALLFLLGDSMDTLDVMNFMKSSDNYWLKSLVLNPDLFHDKYTKERIRSLLIKKVELACLGKLNVRGNFQCIIPDNYAYMEWITGQPVRGLLGRGEFFSSYWNELGVDKVDCMRSPLTHFSEHYVVDLCKSEEALKWYKYSYSGIITNTHDEHTMHFAGSDYDYDILATTDNPQFINGVLPNQRVVTYNVRKPQKKLFTEDDLFITDTFSFGNQIGQITNTTSTFIGLMSLWEKDSPEYRRLIDRVKAGCAAQSRQIDKTKIGQSLQTLGTCCKRYQHIDEDDSPETVAEKELCNRILADKKPYFFKYKYKALHKELNDYNKKHEELSILKFHKSFSELSATPAQDLSSDESLFIKYYYRYLPVVDSPCVMNRICKYIESINFHIKQKVKCISEFDYRTLQTDNFQVNKLIYSKIKIVLEDTFSEWQERIKNNKSTSLEKSLGFRNSDTVSNRELDLAILRGRLYNVCSDSSKLADHLVYYFYEEKPSSNKTILWGLAGQYIFNNILSRINEFDVPVQDPYGDIEFLYKNYQVKHLTLDIEPKDYSDGIEVVYND